MTVATPLSLSSLNGSYAVDPTHSYVGFAVRHAGLSHVRGSFTEFTGTGTWNRENPTLSSLELVINSASIDTHNPDRDAHLRYADFLDAETYPTLSFRSTSMEVLGDTVVRVHGNLTVKDITQPVTVDFTFTGNVTDPFGFDRIGFSGTAKIKRSDWGLVWNVPMAAGNVLVGDTVRLEFEVEALPQAG